MKLRSTWNIQIFGNRFPSKLFFKLFCSLCIWYSTHIHGRENSDITASTKLSVHSKPSLGMATNGWYEGTEVEERKSTTIQFTTSNFSAYWAWTLAVLYYKREFPLATSLQFFFLRGAKNSACKLQFFLQERIADFLAEGAIVFAREIARSCKKRSYSFCNFLSQRLQVEV